MAPISTAATGLQQNRPRPTVSKKLVPALPLSYVQKRQKQQEAAAATAARAKERDAEQTPVPVPVEVVQSPKLPEPAQASTVVNESSNYTSEAAEEDEKSVSPETTTESVEAVEIPTPAEVEQEPVAQAENLSDAQATPQSVPSDERSSASRTTYHMPPPFIPTSQTIPQSNATYDDSLRYPVPPSTFNGQHPLHHAHPSTSSLMFGGYPESSNSSPAPPPSAGNPPYPYHAHQYAQGGSRHGPHISNGNHQPPTTNGYSPMGPPPSGYYPRQEGFIPQGPPEFGRRNMIPVGQFGHPESYSPSHTPYGADGRGPPFEPSTPHSFQGSHSSAAGETEGYGNHHGPYPPTIIANGSNGHTEDGRAYQQPGTKGNIGSQPVNHLPSYPVHPGGQTQVQMETYDGLVNYLISQFADPALADFTLELRYADDRAPPVRIPGHNILFARSPVLKNLMESQVQTYGHTPRPILIESEDRFLRTDSFWMAVQRLYGGPLLDFGGLASVPIPAASQSGAPLPGSPADRFDMALGYAAAGHILQIAPVVSRGIEIASHFISWSTLEQAFDFGLDGGLDNHWSEHNGNTHNPLSPTYGQTVNILLYTALNFVITSFPAGFKLDVSVGDAIRTFRRLPETSADRPSGHNPRLSSIRFGELPSEDITNAESSNNTATVLSKILINLPWHMLKYILESSRLGNVEGWANTALRIDVMHAVIEEREKRRTKIHPSSLSTAQERQSRSKKWDAVDWQEIVTGSEAAPSLARNWVHVVTKEN